MESALSLDVALRPPVVDLGISHHGTRYGKIRACSAPGLPLLALNRVGTMPREHPCVVKREHDRHGTRKGREIAQVEIVSMKIMKVNDFGDFRSQAQQRSRAGKREIVSSQVRPNARPAGGQDLHDVPDPPCPPQTGGNGFNALAQSPQRSCSEEGLPARNFENAGLGRHPAANRQPCLVSPLPVSAGQVNRHNLGATANVGRIYLKNSHETRRSSLQPNAQSAFKLIAIPVAHQKPGQFVSTGPHSNHSRKIRARTAEPCFPCRLHRLGRVVSL